MGIPHPTAGSVALVTGASSGIGLAIATELAARGHDLILVARRRERLEALAEELHRTRDVRVEVMVCDLAEANDRDQLLDAVNDTGLQVDVLILCAGFGLVGPHLDHDGDRVVNLIRTNVESTMALAHALIPAMAQRRRGAVLFVSSMAGNQPIPFFAAYAASKAAVTSLGESLHYELADSGVTVSVLAPANVATEFAAVADAVTQGERQSAFFTATAEQCARAGIEALESGRRKVTPLPQAALFAWLGPRLPRRVWFRICRSMMR
ncbi:SDR family NAD(P)-dependent oxidoreductase [Micromonospora sp. WMMD736]|uniref:SDR family NAD(P)-dependent oxidoreductase n=1 Tax=Micromonospora sp. WMMD736 TaxID=3404112 RepID=UPI003B94E3D9